MPSPKDPRKTQLPYRLKRPCLLPRHVIRRQRRTLESGLSIIRHRLRSRLVAEPIADPIRISGPDHGLHAFLHNVGELG